MHFPYRGDRKTIWVVTHATQTTATYGNVWQHTTTYDNGRGNPSATYFGSFVSRVSRVFLKIFRKKN